MMPQESPEPFRSIVIEFAIGRGYIVSIKNDANAPDGQSSLIDSHYCKDWGLVTDTINAWLESDYH